MILSRPMRYRGGCLAYLGAGVLVAYVGVVEGAAAAPTAFAQTDYDATYVLTSASDAISCGLESSQQHITAIYVPRTAVDATVE